MPPPTIRRTPTLEERVDALEGHVQDIRREIRALVDEEDRRNDYARRQLDDALASAVRIFEKMSASTDAKLDEVLSHSKAAAEERERRRASEEDAAKKKAEAAVDAFEKRQKLRLSLLRYVVLPAFVAIIGAVATCAGVSHVTEGPHGVGSGGEGEHGR